jgi:hypothetical protein
MVEAAVMGALVDCDFLSSSTKSDFNFWTEIFVEFTEPKFCPVPAAPNSAVLMPQTPQNLPAAATLFFAHLGSP